MLPPQLNSTLLVNPLLDQKNTLLLFAWLRKPKMILGECLFLFEKYFKLQMRDECSSRDFKEKDGFFFEDAILAKFADFY